MRTVRTLGAVAVAASLLVSPAVAAQPELGDRTCDVTTLTDPSPTASPDSRLLVIHGMWVESGAREMVLTCSVQVADEGDKVVVRSMGVNGVAVIQPYATTIEIPEAATVYFCSHATWSDAQGYHEESPPCLDLATGSDG